MPDYKEMYHIMRKSALYAATRAEDIAENVFKALRDCEELYAASEEPPIELYNTLNHESVEK